LVVWAGSLVFGHAGRVVRARLCERGRAGWATRARSPARWPYLVIRAESHELRYASWVTRTGSLGLGHTS
jgi:hypothetical protein